MGKTIFDLIEEKTPSQESVNENSENIFSKVPLETQTVSQEEQPQPETEAEKIISENAPETQGEFVKRSSARTGARILETPFQNIKGISNLIEELLSGPEGQTIGPKIVEFLKPYSGIARFIKEPQEMREAEREKHGEYLEPQSPKEEKWDEYVQDATSLAMPPYGAGGAIGRIGSLPLRGLARTGRAMAIAAGGMGAKEVSKIFGGKDAAQGYAKLGTTFLLSLIEPGRANNLTRTLREDAINAMPPNVMGDARRLEGSLQQMRQQLLRTQPTGSSNRIIQEIDGILPHIQNGQLPYDQSVSIKTALNQNSEALYRNPDLDRVQLRATRAGMDEIRGHLKDFIDQSETTHPEFHRNITQSDQVYSALAQSRRVSTFFNENKRVFASVGLSPSALGALFGGLPGVTGAAITTAGLYGGLKTGELISRIINSPVLRDSYLNAVNAALQQNLGMASRSLKEFKKEAEKDPELMKLLREASTSKQKKPTENSLV